jgi:hypothetical protein
MSCDKEFIHTDSQIQSITLLNKAYFIAVNYSTN